MNLDRKSLLVYAITDKSWLDGNSLEEDVEKALKSGASFLQLREKNMKLDEFIDEAKSIKKLADKYEVAFVINDRIEVALEVDADGLHIGQDDMEVKEARKLLGPEKILGVSAVTLEQAKQAEEDGADYIGTGAIFQTATKSDADLVSLEELKKICMGVSIPVVAIGGIDETNILELKGSGVAGLCFISAIFGQDNIGQATNNLRKLTKEIVE